MLRLQCHMNNQTKPLKVNIYGDFNVEEFSKVSPAIWRSRRFRNLESDARLAHIYFLACDHQSSAGCFRLPDAYAAADLSWDVERYRTALEQVVTAGLIAHDEATEEVFVKAGSASLHP